MVLTRNQREQLERDERHARGEFSTEASDSEDEDSMGFLVERKRRNPRAVLTLEEEMARDEDKRQLVRAQKREMLQIQRLGNSGRAGRPERPAAVKAMQRMLNGESDDELLSVPGPRRPPRPHSVKVNSPPAVTPHPDGLVESDDEGYARSDSVDSGGGYVGEDAAADMRRSMTASKKIPLNHHMDRYLSTSAPPRSNTNRVAGEANQQRGGDGDPPADVTPLEVDPSVTFESVGGLPHHILTLREMVMIPLMYPSLVERLSLHPPKGVLFVGPPGTGKTLLARALASEGTRMAGGQKITFFLRKGADVLSKWQGESERQLRLLFDEARRQQPSIIFFDEIDGLAPVRHSKQEQSHAALVSTLLAMMDGLNDRGQVIVIGATNRPETLDPALRRPGRFDRELRFPLPDEAGRLQVLKIHMKGQALKDAATIQTAMVRKTAGWSGADVASLCAEAALQALRRSLPQIYMSSQRLMVDDVDVSITSQDYTSAAAVVQPSTGRHAGGNDVGLLPPPILEVVKGETDAIRAQMSRQWVPAARHLAEANFASQVSTNASSQAETLACALSSSLAKPLTSMASTYLLQLLPPSKGESGAALCDVVARALTASLSALYTHTFHMPNVGRSGAQGEANKDLFISGGGPESFQALFSSLANATPSVALLLGFDEWYASAPDDERSHFFYNANAICGRDVCLVVPRECGAEDIAPFVANYVRGSYTVKEPSMERKVAFLDCVVSTYVDSRDSIAQFASMMGTLMPSGEHVHSPWPELPVDSRPLQHKVSEQDREVVMEHWNKIEHRRRQLRHILHTWVSKFITNRRFAPLISADLDFTSDHELYSKWQRHVRGKKIGLQDMIAKLENDEYTCLSAYNKDMDTLCNNVRDFFVISEGKYRPRAVELKETTLLNMYRIQKSLVKFCEDNKDAVEPQLDEDQESEARGSKRPRSSGRGSGRGSSPLQNAPPADSVAEVPVPEMASNPDDEAAKRHVQAYNTKPISALIRLHAAVFAHCHSLRLLASADYASFTFPPPAEFFATAAARSQ